MALRQRLEGHSQYGVLAEAVDALALVKQGKYDEAMRAAEQLSKIPALRAESLMIAGEAFHGQGKWREAIGAFQRAVALQPDLVRAHRWLGAIYFDTGAMQLATDELRRVAELDASDCHSLRLCGLIQYEYQKYDQAVKDYRRALKRSPPKQMESEIRIKLADSLQELRKVGEALAALAECDDTADVLTQRAICYETGGKIDAALEQAQHAIKLAPRHPKANLALGRLYLAQRRPKDAIGPLQIAVDVDPANHEPRFFLGRAMIQMDRVDEGKAQLAQSTKLKEAFLEMADLHVEAIGHPNDAAIRLKLAQAAEKLGRIPIALSWYRATLGLDPQNKEAAKAIERLKTSVPSGHKE